MADGLVLPRVHVMVLCDDIEQRPGVANVYDLEGVRSELRASTFPYTHAKLWVYLQLTGHEGTAPCRIELLRAATDTLVFRVPDEEIEFTGPLDIVHYSFEVLDCEFPSPGLYYIQVYHQARLIHERLLELVEETTNGQASE